MAKRSNDAPDAECEKAYRRGYANGIHAMMSAVVDTLSDTQRQSFEDWFESVLTPWSKGAGPSRPPEPPRWY